MCQSEFGIYLVEKVFPPFTPRYPFDSPSCLFTVTHRLRKRDEGAWLTVTVRATDSLALQLVLLLLAAQIALTTATCIAEYNSWDELGVQEKNKLAWLYVPYLGFGRFAYFLLRLCGPMFLIFAKVDTWGKRSEGEA